MSERLVRLLRRAYAAPEGGASDADLLARVAAGKDDAAFELLVRRHAEMVWRVCRQVARDHHAAEDAFQATFLALLRRAAAVRDESAAGFLHRVAFHAALKAKPTAPTAPLPADGPPSPALPPDRQAEASELAPLLHAELNRLPDRYRLPLVLCQLEGYTQAEAAARLGWPLGTVATGVRRGGDRLRDRLVRRGVGVPAAGLAALLSGPDATAISSHLITLTAGLGSGTGVPGPAVARLATGALSAMRYAQTKTLFAAVAVAAVAAGGVTWSVGQTPQPGPKPAAAEPAKPATVPLPKVFDYFDQQRSMKSLRRIGLAFHDYHDDKGVLPMNIVGKDGTKLLSWRVALLPYLNHELLYSRFRLDEPWDGDHNKTLLQFIPKLYSDGVIPPDGRTYVKRFTGPRTMFEADRPLSFGTVTDGLANTVMAAAVGPAVPWTEPDDLQYDPAKPPPPLVGPCADGFAVVFGDGSARWLDPNPDPEYLRRLVLRDDNEIITDPPVKPRPPRPLTNREARNLSLIRESFPRQRAEAEKWADEVERLKAEVRKSGPVPWPELPQGDDLPRSVRASEAINELLNADIGESHRLWQVLEKRDPEAAARLRKELEAPKPADTK